MTIFGVILSNSPFISEAVWNPSDVRPKKFSWKRTHVWVTIQLHVSYACPVSTGAALTWLMAMQFFAREGW